MTMTSSASGLTHATQVIFPTSCSTNRDDFTQFTGIGPVIQKQLHEVLGVQTFRDLARLAPDEALSQLRQVNRMVSQQQVASWIAQAQEQCSPLALNGAEEMSTEILEVHPEVHETQRCPAATPSGVTPAAPVAMMQWMVEVIEVTPSPSDVCSSDVRSSDVCSSDVPRQYQTVIRQRQTGDVLAHWPGVAMDAVHHWLTEQWEGYQTAHRMKASSSEPLSSTITGDGNNQPGTEPSIGGGERSPIIPTITEVRFYQPLQYPRSVPMDRATFNQPMRHPLKRMDAFTLDVQFKCAQLQHLNDAQPLRYVVEVYAHHRESRSVICLGQRANCTLEGSRQRTESLTNPTYLAELPTMYLPKAGTYRLKLLVKLRGIEAIPGYLEIPKVHVI